jgi:hypothetical protein
VKNQEWKGYFMRSRESEVERSKGSGESRVQRKFDVKERMWTSRKISCEVENLECRKSGLQR